MGRFALAERPFLCYNAPVIKTEQPVPLRFGGDDMRVMDEETLERVEKYNMDYQTEHGISPSYRQIMHALNLKSLATVQRYLNVLEKQGRISRTRLGTIEPLPQLKASAISVAPLVGRIACGQPTLAIENIEESIALPTAIFGNGKLFLLRAFGNSMIEAGIDEGDLLVIRQQDVADDGEIVVALIDGEATLKRIYHRGGKIILHPENKTVHDIVVTKCDVQGVLVSCIKKFS